VLVSDEAIVRGAAGTVGRRASSPSRAPPCRSRRASGAYVPAPGERVGVVVCGGNTTAVDFGPRPAASAVTGR
jgi:threonine dehydratase